MFYYLVEYIDREQNKTIKESGIVSAANYEAAAKRVEEYYLDVCSMHLEQWEDLLCEDEILDGFEEADVRA